MNRLELLFWKVARYLLIRQSGEKCRTKDTDDFKDEDISKSRCPICHNYDMAEWIDKRLEFIRWKIKNKNGR